MRNKRGFLAALVLLVGLVGCDHVTKDLARARLSDGTVTPVMGTLFDLRYAENRDVAFNLLRWMPEPVRGPLLLVGGGLGIAALATLLVRGRRAGPAGARAVSPAGGGSGGLPWPGDRWQAAALLLILAGALGNTLDRLVRGYVVDFMHVPHWPVFNVADVYVTVGALAMALARARAGRAPAG
jgi:signal peptidase II